jgi:hypothetical protein
MKGTHSDQETTSSQTHVPVHYRETVLMGCCHGSISSPEGPPFCSTQRLAPVWVTWGISSPRRSNLYFALIYSCYRGRGIWQVINTDDDSYSLLMDEAVNWIAWDHNILPAITAYLKAIRLSVFLYVSLHRPVTTTLWFY